MSLLYINWSKILIDQKDKFMQTNIKVQETNELQHKPNWKVSILAFLQDSISQCFIETHSTSGIH